jgi:hypothetical protein
MYDSAPDLPAPDRLAAQITSLCGHLYAETYRLLCLIREFDEQGYWEVEGVCSCAHWLNWQCGIGMNAAREKVRVARALATLPKISEAFSRGEISYSKVRAMTRVADADSEDYLLMIAEYGTAHHVEQLVAKYRRVRRLEDAQNADAQHLARELTTYTDDDGSLVIHARLPAEVGAMVLKALELATERQFRARRAETRDDVTAATSGTPDSAPDGGSHKRDVGVDESDAVAESVAAAAAFGDDSPAPECVAEAVLDRTPHDQDAPYPPDPPSGPPHEPPCARSADALAHIAEHYLASRPAHSCAADRYQVVVHVSAETLAEGATATESPATDSPATRETSSVTRTPSAAASPTPAAPPPTGGSPPPLPGPHLADGPHVSAETARRIGCDSTVLGLIMNAAGEPLSVGRRTRSVPPSIRRALKTRDRGCRFPGCTYTDHLDAHHIHHWADGGETSVDNLVQLCRHHHRLVHEGGFSCERNANGTVIFRDKRGERLATGDALPPAAARRAFDAWITAQLGDLGITADTCVTRWNGPIDWHLAVAGLCDASS